MTRVRVEEDALGSKEVPAYAYYGVHTIRAFENISLQGYGMPQEVIPAMAMVKKAAALTNMEWNRLNRNLGHVIVQAAQEMIDGRWHEHVILNPFQCASGSAFNMNMNEVIANRALELLGESKGQYETLSPMTHVNMSQNRNGAFSIAASISIMGLMRKLLESMNHLHLTVRARAEQCKDSLDMGPIATFAEVLMQDINHMSHTQGWMYKVSAGAIGGGADLPFASRYFKRVVEVLADESGFPLEVVECSTDTMQNGNAYLEVSTVLKACMIHVSEAAAVLCSIAADILNPVTVQVMSHDYTVSLAMEKGKLQLEAMEPLIAYHLLQSIRMLDQVMILFNKYLD